MQIVNIPSKIRMRNLNDLVNQIAGSSFKSLISHILVFDQEVVWGSSWHIEHECFQALGYFLTGAEMTLPSNHLTFSLASRADVGEHVIKTIAQIYTTSYTTLAITFLS